MIAEPVAPDPVLPAFNRNKMKICVAQSKPVKGNIQRNIDDHKRMIDLAVSNGARMIIFPELSLTGYEPLLAKALATDSKDSRFDGFQLTSDLKDVVIGAGIPIKTPAGILIGMIIFRPSQSRQIYFKQYLHADELPYFVSGPGNPVLEDSKIALAICYELSIHRHSANAFKRGAEIYIASVAKTGNGVEKAIKSLAGIAKKYSMTVLMSNCAGHCDDFECGGKTSIWNSHGFLVAQLNESDEGILMIDTDTQELICKIIITL